MLRSRGGGGGGRVEKPLRLVEEKIKSYLFLVVLSSSVVVGLMMMASEIYVHSQ